ncbi:MAG: hypothetical protein RRY34_07355 [Victivallaceae bacterium]
MEPINYNFDFGQYFHTSNKMPLYYKMRYDENKYHDLAYIASYLHEATFNLHDITFADGRLEINVTRIRWELYQYYDELEDIKSSVVFNNIKNYELVHKKKFEKSHNFEICDIFFYDDTFLIKTTFDFLDIKVFALEESDFYFIDEK